MKEEKLPQQFARYENNSIMRLIKIIPAYVTFILLASGKGFMLDFSEGTAISISHEM